RLTTGELFTGGTFNFNGGTLEITDAAQALTVGSTEFSFTNGSSFNTSAGTTTLAANQNLEIAGAATVENGATLTMAGGSLTSGSFTNNGMVHTTSGTSTIAGDVQNNGGFQVDTGSGLLFLDDLSGDGPFTGGGEVTFQGGLNPGNSPGTLEFGGDVTLGATSLTTIEIAGLGTTDFDRLLLNNLDALLTIENGAGLDVQLINGFSLDFNQEFVFAEIAGTNAPVGTFSGLGGDVLGEGDLVGNFGGFDLFISYSAGTGNDISFFTSVPEPSALAMFGLVAGLSGLRRRRRSV
ncbi:MAG: PEP-CTERM sorting domain-containing protein, partial [Pirellulaceae bacterium]|nr:PEP-CTERM sorting domain-containing protein [Pirellulaceae bacterium]